jgi:hypothetical protein
MCNSAYSNSVARMFHGRFFILSFISVLTLLMTRFANDVAYKKGRCQSRVYELVRIVFHLIGLNLRCLTDERVVSP